MAELDVPTIKQGIFNGFPIEDLQGLVRDTMAAMPYLKEAQESGAYRGEMNARFNTEPIPPFLHLRHFPNDIALDKVKEWAKDVEMIPDVRRLNSEEWGFVHYNNVDPELAKLLDAAFPYRSAEFLPNFQNPDTGEIYPVVLRSVAFLDANTEPAVPQFPGYSVKLASRSESGVLTVACMQPNQKQIEEENTVMGENTSTVKLSQEDIQKLRDEFRAEFSKDLEAVKAENQVLKGAVNEMKAEKDTLSSQVLKLQAENKTSQVETFCLKLERDYNLTESAMQAIRPVVSAEDGVVKMSAESDPVPLEQAYMQSLENIIKLAKTKDALFIPESVNLPTGKQPIPKLSAAEAQEAAIQKEIDNAKAQGKELDYATARMKVVKLSNAILDRIDKEGE